MTDIEKDALERRIDELCAEVERLHADQAHWELGNCPSCPNVVSLQEALEQNAKLREENQSVGMAAYELGRASMADENAKLLELVNGLTWCCEYGCDNRCPLYDRSEPDHCREQWLKRELGIEVAG